MESQPQNPEFRNNLETFTHAFIQENFLMGFPLISGKKSKLFLFRVNIVQRRLLFICC